MIDRPPVDDEAGGSPTARLSEATEGLALVVGLAPRRIAEDLIRPRDPLEAPFHRGVVGVPVRVRGSRQPAVRRTDLALTRTCLKFQGRVVPAAPFHYRRGDVSRDRVHGRPPRYLG